MTDLLSDYIPKKYGRIEDPAVLLQQGKTDSLSVSDLLSVLLVRSGSETKDMIAERVIKEYGSLALKVTRDPVMLSRKYNLTLGNATKIVAAMELASRFYQTENNFIIRDPEDVYQHLRYMANLKKEHLHMLCLDTKNRVIHEETVSVGTLAGTPVHPREVFNIAISFNAGSIIIVHNHPSGEYEPSGADDSITRMIKEAGDMIQIPMVDHIVIAHNGFYSYNKEHRI